MSFDGQIRLQISEDVAARLQARLISREVVEKAIHHAETTGAKLINPGNCRSLTSQRKGTVTYWVEYSPSGEGYLVHSAYCHRMGMRTGGGLTDGARSPSESGWVCNLCQVSLEVQKVRLQYMQSIFPIDLPVCPGCSLILIDEELATGKLAEVEQILEDK